MKSREDQASLLGTALARLGLARSVDAYAERCEAGEEPEVHMHMLVRDDKRILEDYVCDPKKCKYNPNESVYLVEGVLQPPGYNPLLPETYAKLTYLKYKLGNYQM